MRDMLQFRNDDAGYRQWLKDHPNGFVVNSERIPNPSYLILHRATCYYISNDTTRNYTTTSYIKTCSEDLAELRWWAGTLSGQLGQRCYCLTSN